MAILHAVAGDEHMSEFDVAVAECVGSIWRDIVAAYASDFAARGVTPPRDEYVDAKVQERLLHPCDYVDAPGESNLPADGALWGAVHVAAERVREAGLHRSRRC